MNDFKDQVVVITGASSGLGADAARCFAAHNANVVCLARRKDKLDSVRDEITELGSGKAISIKCDVTKEEEVKQAVEEIKAEFGKVDVLINNAGTAFLGTVETLDDSEWDKAIDTNIKGIISMSKYIIPLMRERKYGRVINISSVNAFLASKSDKLWRHAYNATKAAVIGLTIGMAGSYTNDGITSNAVCPGLFKTEMTENSLFKSEDFMNMYNSLCPASRPANRGELNSSLLFFASKDSGYITGQSIIVDGGFSIV